MIRIRGLRVHYPLRRSLGDVVARRPPALVRAVDGVDLDIGRGEIVALVGESGSGKTTTGRAIARLAPITAGTLALEDQDVTAVSGRALRGYRRRVQIIFQDPYESLDPRRPSATRSPSHSRSRAWGRSRNGLRGSTGRWRTPG